MTWTSSDEEIATVDETGLVTAVGAGEAESRFPFLTQTFHLRPM
ncbi:Ig-like domain-containing protein [uncultured Gemmiger sp.]